jgi:membrane protein
VAIAPLKRSRSLLRRHLVVLRRLPVLLWRDNCLESAKGAAYSALLGFFPFVTTIATFLMQANAEAVSRRLARFLLEVAPPGAGEAMAHPFRSNWLTDGSRPTWLLIFAILLSVWSASDVIVSFINGFHATWRQRDPRGFWRQRAGAVWLVFAVLAPSVLASSLLIAAAGMEVGLARLMNWKAAESTIVQVANVVASTAALWWATAILYRYGPRIADKPRPVWPGALLATGLWLGATVGFGWYVRKVAKYSVLYGSIGAAVALLIWMYLVALIALAGFAYNAELYRYRRSLSEAPR